MDAKTLEALKASIAKWERNAEAEEWFEFKTGSKNCQLCKMFIDDGCEGCPVSENTGKRYCVSTPYDSAHCAWFDWREGIKGAADRAHAAARDEVAFLRSLLLEETP